MAEIKLDSKDGYRCSLQDGDYEVVINKDGAAYVLKSEEFWRNLEGAERELAFAFLFKISELSEQ